MIIATNTDMMLMKLNPVYVKMFLIPIEILNVKTKNITLITFAFLYGKITDIGKPIDIYNDERKIDIIIPDLISVIVFGIK